MASNSPNRRNILQKLQILWNVVNDPQIDDIVCWDNNGKSFIIKDEKRFASEICYPLFSSYGLNYFYRLMHECNFQRIPTTNVSEIKFYHVHFLKENFELLNYIPSQQLTDVQSPERLVGVNVQSPEGLVGVNVQSPEGLVGVNVRSPEKLIPVKSSSTPTNSSSERRQSVINSPRIFEMLKQENEILQRRIHSLQRIVRTLEDKNKRLSEELELMKLNNFEQKQNQKVGKHGFETNSEGKDDMADNETTVTRELIRL